MELKRNIYSKLSEWKKSSPRDPLVLFGSRQSGKTHAIKYFAKQHYRKIHEVNFWKLETFQEAFVENDAPLRDAKRILKKLELVLDTSVDINTDLLLFDEIQDCPTAYESLKFFKEDIPQLDLIASGSYLQLFLNQNTSVKKYPVGSTKDLLLTPLSFEEFLMNASLKLYEAYLEIDINAPKIDALVHSEISKYFYYYLFTGGLPEVIIYFLSNYKESLHQAASICREKQNNLINQYKNDLNKYAQNKDVPKLRKLFDNIALQLNQYQNEEVGKYSFKEIAGNQGYRVLKSSFDYLSLSGLIILSHIINQPFHPLPAESSKESQNKFKAFLFDVGLLQAILDIPFNSIIQQGLGAYKGYLVENFVAQQLFAKEQTSLYSFKSSMKSESSEIEFLISRSTEIIPIEVKSSARYSKSKSLNAYVKKFQPQKAFKLTPNNIGKGQGFLSLPIYLVGKI